MGEFRALLNGLIIRVLCVEMVLDRKKTWEIRGRYTHVRGRCGRYWLKLPHKRLPVYLQSRRKTPRYRSACGQDQSAPLPGRAVLEVSSGHTSKFAAPFKCLFGDSLKPCLPLSRGSTARATSTFFYRSEEPAPDWKVQFFSYCQLRAPPSA